MNNFTDFLGKKAIIAYHALLVGAILFLLFTYFYRNDKIAYVDSGRILNEYKGAIEGKKVYQAKVKIWQTNIDTLTNEVKKIIQEHQKNLKEMSSKEKELSMRLVQDKERQLENYQKGIQENAKQEDGKLTQTIVTQVNAFLLDYGKRNNYKLILIANQSGTIAYGREGLDITTIVLDELNSRFAAGLIK